VASASSLRLPSIEKADKSIRFSSFRTHRFNPTIKAMTKRTMNKMNKPPENSSESTAIPARPMRAAIKVIIKDRLDLLDTVFRLYFWYDVPA
jgi:hypothetical protein